LIRSLLICVAETMVKRRALQVSIAIAALLPVVAGLWGVTQPASDGAWAGNHHRYLSGLRLAVGLGYWSTVPEIETMGARMRLLTAVVMVGGLARLVGLVLGDAPTLPVAAALAMELLVAPLLCLLQICITSRSQSDLPGVARLKPHLRHIAP
jgi:hypothetical protein